MTKQIRTRFAPSPTGPLHIGGLRTALYCYLFAKKNKGTFILRIEDTDTARTVSGSEKIINDSLKWCGIIPDESVEMGGQFGPYKQSERKEIYLKYSKILIEAQKAYIAFDSEEEIALWRENTAKSNNGTPLSYNYNTRMSMKNSLTLSKEDVDDLLNKNTPYVVRLKVEPTDNISFNDLIRGNVSINSSQLDDRVLLKSDGMPTYHLANVVDDYLMKITHVIRGEEWLASTSHHILLYKGFGWEDSMPQFAHLPLIMKPEGNGKLSKRDGDRLGFPVFVVDWKDPITGQVSKGYKEKGFLPDAFINFMALLGWNDGSNNEIFSIEELINSFDIERVHKAGAKFSFDKALWFNQEYLKNKDNKFFIDILKQKIDITNYSDEFLELYCNSFKYRINSIEDFFNVGDYIFKEDLSLDKELVQNKVNDEGLLILKEFASILNENLSSTNELIFNDLCKQNNVKLGKAMPLLRLALVGKMEGPSVFDIIELLGIEKSKKRISLLLNLVE